MLFGRKRPVSKGSSGAAPSLAAARTVVSVCVVEDSHSYEADDGSCWWSAGHAPVYEDDDGDYHFVALGEHLCEGHVLYCKVAGVRHYGAALEDRRFRPGSKVLLRPEPDNPHDANAVGVWDQKGSLQIGHIPAECCAEVAQRIQAREEMAGYVLREIRRGSKSGPRSALHLLVALAGDLRLSIVDD